MRIFVLEDSPTRHLGFRLRFKSDILVMADTIKESTEALLNNPKFDEIWLDRDINDHGRVSLAQNNATLEYAGFGYRGWLTGEHLAEWITSKLPKDKRPDKVHIHSHNDFAVPRMVKMLSNAGIVTTNERWDHPSEVREQIRCPHCHNDRTYTYQRGWFCKNCGFYPEMIGANAQEMKRELIRERRLLRDFVTWLSAQPPRDLMHLEKDAYERFVHIEEKISKLRNGKAA